MDYLHTLSLIILVAFFSGQSSIISMRIDDLDVQNNHALHQTNTLNLTRGNAPDPYPCTQKEGTVIESSMDSAIYHAPVKYIIYLPPCFDEKASLRYPVLYLLNGQTFDNQQWIRLGLPTIMDDLINNQRMAPAIVVLPNDLDWRQPEESPFGRMLVEEMIPYIDQNYPSYANRQYRAIGGLSRGASWALRLGLTEWQLFSRIGAHSLPVFAMDNSSIPSWLDDIPPESVPQVYIDMGDQDPELNVARNVEHLLSDRHLPHEWHMFTGTHEETYWARHLQKYLLWYACEWTVLYYN
jgi:enterochelin esterase-like enzyme